MKDTMAQQIYDALTGVLCKEHQIPGVENAFAEGTPCAMLYRRVLEAYERLWRRLNVQDEDEDAEIMINALWEISHILGIKMYEYGIDQKNCRR